MRIQSLVLTLVAVCFLVSGAVAQTYYASGGDGTGGYSSALYIDDAGNIAVALVAVEGGTYSEPQSAISQQTNEGNGLEQEYLLSAEHGEAFAGISGIAASGDQASTVATVTNGQATVYQELGFESLLDTFGESVAAGGIYAHQDVYHAYGEVVHGSTQVVSANGESAGVSADVSGNLTFLEQTAATWSLFAATEEFGIDSLSETYAEQMGMIGGSPDRDYGVSCFEKETSSGIVAASASDKSGNTAGVSASVVNGTLCFFQIAGSDRDWETFGESELSGVSAMQMGMIGGSSYPTTGYEGSFGFGRADSGAVSATATDSSGNTAGVTASVVNGTLFFFQETGTGFGGSCGFGESGVDVSGLYASQHVSLCGTSGNVSAFASNADESTYSVVSSGFANHPYCGGYIPSGTILAHAESELISYGEDDTETAAFLCEHEWGKLHGFTVSAETQDDEDTETYSWPKPWRSGAVAISDGCVHVWPGTS